MSCAVVTITAFFCEIGAFSYKKQKKLLGDPSNNEKDMEEVILNEIKLSDLSSVRNIPDINSLRIYTRKPYFERITDGVWAVFILKKHWF